MKNVMLCSCANGPSFQRSFLPALSRYMRDVASSFATAVDLIYTRQYHIPGNSSLTFSYRVDVIADYCYHFSNYMN